MLRAPLVPIALAFLLGVSLGAFVPLLWSLAVAAVAVAAAIAAHRLPRMTQWLLLLAVCGLGAARLALAHQLPPHHIAHLADDMPRSVSLHGIVSSDPVEMDAPFGESRTTAVLALRDVKRDETWRSATGLVRVTLLDPAMTLRYGDELLVHGALRRPPPPSHPGAFNYRAYLERQGIFAAARARPLDGVAVLRHRQGHWLVDAAYRCRARTRTVLHRYLPTADADLLAALLIGDRSGLSPDVEDAFIRTGTIHVVAISGFNVGIIAACTLWLLRLLWVPRRWRLLLTMGLLGVFMLMTDSRAPVVRATVMAWTLLGGMLLHRTGAIANALGLAALAILAWQPQQLGDAGFQLSFAAVLAIVALAPRLMRWMERSPASAALLETRWGRYFASLFAASVAASAGVAPLVLHHFGIVTPIGLVANLLVIPLISILLIGGMGLVLAGSLATLLGTIVGWWLARLTELCVLVVTWAARVPGGGWYVAPLPWWGVALLYGCGALAWHRRSLKLPEARVAIVWLLVLNAWLWGRALTPTRHALQMTALDVGRGDALLLEFPSRGRLLIDGGSGWPHDQGRAVIAPYLRARGIRRLDAVVLTRSDSHHVGGLATVLEAFDVGAVIENGDEPSTVAFRRYRAILDAKHIPRVVAREGDGLVGFPGVTVDIVQGSHRRSLALRIRHGTQTFLLPRDTAASRTPPS